MIWTLGHKLTVWSDKWLIRSKLTTFDIHKKKGHSFCQTKKGWGSLMFDFRICLFILNCKLVLKKIFFENWLAVISARTSIFWGQLYRKSMSIFRRCILTLQHINLFLLSFIMNRVKQKKWLREVYVYSDLNIACENGCVSHARKHRIIYTHGWLGPKPVFHIT